MDRPVSDIAFTPAVKAQQVRRGSRVQYERMERARGWSSTISPELAAFIGEVGSFYLGTASADGQPYIQHRGGPKGFLTVLDEQTLGFADYGGNRQYITAGNLSENPRAFLFLMDYARRLRIKIWGEARIVEDDEALLARVRPPAGGPPAERAIVFDVKAWDRNCPQHIPQLLAIEDVEAAVAPLRERIAELERELARVREAPGR